MKLYYCMMGYNRLNEIEYFNTVGRLLPYVDQFIYVDGSCGKDGTERWLMEEYPDAPIVVIHSEWSDDFPGQRTNYLNLVGELREKDEDSWVIVNDTDEVFSELLAKNIRKIIESASKSTDMLLIRCKSVTIDNNGERVYENMDDFYKPLVFKYYPGMIYWGDRSQVTGGKTALHESLQCDGRFVWRPKKLSGNDDLHYEHIKLENIIWERGLRNFIVFGGGPNLGEKQPLWVPFRKMLAKAMGTEEYTSYDAIQYFKAGNITQELKDWMIAHRHEDGYDGASEVRECYKTYFKLYHPDQMPDELRGEQLK